MEMEQVLLLRFLFWVHLKFDATVSDIQIWSTNVSKEDAVEQQEVLANNFLVRSKAMAMSGLLWVAFLPDEHHPIWWSALPCLV